ncbi:MAG: RraA family protein [Chloroflexi bacterium]|nr:RraA family protein [Chloroflexota bacterium]
MFIIKPNPPALDAELVERYRHIEPTTVGHRLNAGFVGVDIKPVWRRQHITGRAITVRTVGIDSTIVHKATELVQPGDVVIVDMAGEREHSCWGGGVSRAARAHGAIGAVIDGPVCDVNEIEDLQFPVWGRAWTCLTTRMLGTGGEINVPVRCGNAVVNPGDLIIADDCGVIALSPEMAWQWLPEFEMMQKRSSERLPLIEQGTPLGELSGANRLIEAKQKEIAEKLAQLKEKK